jgi:hypothetical protein
LINFTEILVWLSLTVFVFKMQSVRNKLIAEVPEDFEKRELINKRSRIAVFSILFIYMVATTVLDLVFSKDEQERFPYKAYDGVMRVSKFLVDLYLYFMFIVLYIYFFKLKK